MNTAAQAVIFDLDGTLLDSLRDIADSVNRVLAQRAFPPLSFAQYRQFIGKGAVELMRSALPVADPSDELIMECLEEFVCDYSRHCSVQTRLFEGVASMLSGLAAANVRLAILSNKPLQATRQCVDTYLHQWLFEQVIGVCDTIPAKPDPSGLLYVIGKMGLRPDQVLFVGDMQVDMQTAVAAGACGVGAQWGYRSREELVHSGAQAVIARPLDLLQWFR